MTGLKKEIFTIIILAVMAVTGIYIVNANPVVEQTSVTELENKPDM